MQVNNQILNPVCQITLFLYIKKTFFFEKL